MGFTKWNEQHEGTDHSVKHVYLIDEESEMSMVLAHELG